MKTKLALLVVVALVALAVSVPLGDVLAASPVDLAKDFAVRQTVDATAAALGVYGEPCRNVVAAGSDWKDPGVTAWDLADGDITDKVVVDYGDLDLRKPGVYEITYNVMDSEGNPAVQFVREVKVVDLDPPIIIPKGCDE